LSGRGLCDELITRPEESYRLCCVVVCDLETSRMGAPYIYIYIHDISSLKVKPCPIPARNAVEGSVLVSVQLEYAYRFQPDKSIWDTAIYRKRQSLKGISPSLRSVSHVLASAPQILGSWFRFPQGTKM